MLQCRFLNQKIHYDGSQLRSLFGYQDHGVLGDSLIAWQGSCDVSDDHMVDGEDLRANAKIRGGHMLHFIFETFVGNLITGVCWQRLFAAVMRDIIVEMAIEKSLALKLKRDGDDLWCEDRKLSISVATVSPASVLFHFAVNVDNVNTPVPTLSLVDLGVDAEQLVQRVFAKWTAEFNSIVAASKKVRWVK